MKYFLALVIKSGLENGNNDIPDILFVCAESKEEAITMISKKQFTDSLWIKNKSVCRISKVLDISELSSNAIVCNNSSSYSDFVSLLDTVTVKPIRRRKKVKK